MLNKTIYNHTNNSKVLLNTKVAIQDEFLILNTKAAIQGEFLIIN